MRPAVVRTVGHGTRTTPSLAALLRRSGVETVIDVRRHPLGRRQPHLSRERLARDLPAEVIAYEWWGEAFGGRRSLDAEARAKSRWRNPGFAAFEAYMSDEAFRAALARFEERVESGERMALMCAETVWWRCHRRLIAGALVNDGFTVEHLIGDVDACPHRVIPA